MRRRLPVIAVLGQGSPLSADRAELARAAGALVARLRAHLLTGGGYGVMEAASEGFVAVPGRPGFCLGMIPCEDAFDRPRRDGLGRAYPNAFVEIAVFTPLPARAEDWQREPTRNHINVLSADALLALPGGAGTGNELDMAAHYRGEAARPRGARRTILLGPEAEFTPEQRNMFVHAATIADAEAQLRRILSKGHGGERAARSLA